MLRCCLPRTFCPVLVIVCTNSNCILFIRIIFITNCKCCICGRIIPCTNRSSSTCCSIISITHSHSRVSRCFISSTDCYLTIMTSIIISLILITYNDRVLTNIIVFAIETRMSISPDINMTIAIIRIGHGLLRRNTAHSTSYS